MILVTGGAGYIGTHTCTELLNSGYDVLVLDNYSNSSPLALDRVERITQKTLIRIEGDARDPDLLDQLFANYPIKAVIHFAGFKAVGESCQIPLAYYHNNFYSTLVLSQCMQKAGITKLVFSSSATVYGDPEVVPLTEAMPTNPANPYGRTKLMVEQMLQDLAASDALATDNPQPWGIALLRYFNPVGAHQSGLIGEDPSGIPNNLMPFITQVAVGKRDQLDVFGDDYDTPDGTGVRDYIHVVDLARGHVMALERLLDDQITGAEAINLGTGLGVSVLDMVNSFTNNNSVAVPYQIADRRAGDVASYYADPSKAFDMLGWSAEHTLSDMVTDSWRWQKNNPEGYAD
jgi:UDP-glucose 4-epimerase